MKSKYKVLTDGFVWKLVNKAEGLDNIGSVFALYEDGTEALIDDVEEFFDIAKNKDVKFGLETPFRVKFANTKIHEVQVCRLYINDRNTYYCISRVGHKPWAALYPSDYKNERQAHKFINGNRDSAFNFLLNRVEGYYKRLTRRL
jgi:hypothetical protein